MFNDIIIESASLHDPLLIHDSIRSLKHKQIQIFREAAISKLSSSLSSIQKPLTESDDNKPSLIRRLIDAFKRLIAKIKEWLDNKFKISETKLIKILTLLHTKDFKKIEIDAPKNINDMDIIVERLYKGADELIATKVDTILETVKSKGLIGKAIIGYQIWKDTFLAGYVPTYKKYNDMTMQEIKDDVFGENKRQSNINIAKFEEAFKHARALRTRLDRVSSEYEITLTELSTAIKAMEVTHIVNEHSGQLLDAVMTEVTQYFNRNVSLITTLTIDSGNIIMSTAVKMAHASGTFKVVNENET